MTVSVCMGIYNGEKYIEKQLQTILRQSKPADEVILCDDGSSDATIDIVKRFIRNNKLEKNWKLYQNPENKGYPGNFYYAMSLCTQDVVFLADQDDIWDATKIEKMCDILERYAEVNLISCKFGLIDAEDNKIHTIMQPTRSSGTTSCKQIDINQVFYKYEWPGMVVAYRNMWYNNKLRERKIEISKITIPHDFLICAWAAEESFFLQMDIGLAYHRRHESNVGGEEHRIRKLLNREGKLEEISKYIQLLEAFELNKVLTETEALIALKDKQEVMMSRQEALKKRIFFSVIRNAMKYRKEIRWSTVVCDLILVLRKNDNITRS